MGKQYKLNHEYLVLVDNKVVAVLRVVPQLEQRVL